MKSFCGHGSFNFKFLQFTIAHKSVRRPFNYQPYLCLCTLSLLFYCSLNIGANHVSAASILKSQYTANQEISPQQHSDLIKVAEQQRTPKSENLETPEWEDLGDEIELPDDEKPVNVGPKDSEFNTSPPRQPVEQNPNAIDLKPKPSETISPENTAQNSADELEFWRSVKNSTDANELKAYLESYPNGRFAKLAKLRIKRLETNKSSSGKTAFTPPSQLNTGPFADAPPPPPIEKDIGYVGIEVRNVTQAESEQNGLGRPRGAFAITIVPDSPASSAGLRYGDIILRIGLTDVSGMKNFTDIASRKRPGDVVNLEILRNKEQKTLSITIGAYGRDTRLSAMKGNKQSMLFLGQAYTYGRFGKRDYGPAKYWLDKAAEKGMSQAMVLLGSFYASGLGVPKDSTQSLNWYRKAANAGNREGMFRLANRLSNNGDHYNAYRWWKDSAERGHIRSMTNVGWAYYTGRGTTKDFSQAITWYRKAALKGNSTAMVNMGWAYVHGKGVRKSTAESYQWFRSAAEANNGQGMYGMAWSYAFGQGVSKNNSEAARWMVKALRKKSSDAEKNIAKGNSVWAKDFRRAFQRELTNEGVYSGSIDGSWGPATRAAIDELKR